MIGDRKEGLKVSHVYLIYFTGNYQSKKLFSYFPRPSSDQRQNWCSGLLHILLLLWDYALGQLTIPASPQTNCEMVYLVLSFPPFQSSCFLFPHFSQGLEVCISFSVCPPLPKAGVYSGLTLQECFVYHTSLLPFVHQCLSVLFFQDSVVSLVFEWKTI